MVGDRIGDMDVEYAATVADGAIQSMAKQSVPATPNNFSVWSNYAMGASDVSWPRWRLCAGQFETVLAPFHPV
jgi:hypothetical protein